MSKTVIHLNRVWMNFPVTRTACNRRVPKLAPGQKSHDALKHTGDTTAVTCQRCKETIYYRAESAKRKP